MSGFSRRGNWTRRDVLQFCTALLSRGVPLISLLGLGCEKTPAKTEHPGIDTPIISALRARAARLVRSEAALTPTEPQYYAYKDQVLTDDLGGTYNKFITKSDVVWVDDIIHIKDPLITNGGDAVLFAKLIVVEAPIDTRVAIDTYGFFWDVDPNVPFNVHTIVSMNDFDLSMYGNNQWRFFNDLRFWEDRYDPATRAYRFRGKGELPMIPRPGDKEAFIKIPKLPIGNYQLPSGKNPHHGYNSVPQNGSDAPNQIVNRAATRSGNIYMFAEDIQICPESTLPTWEKAADGDDYDYNRPVFFYASGLKGGRGGPGSYQAGNGLQLPQEEYFSNGISGKAGRGGDAGSVYFYILNADKDWLQEQTSAIGEAQKKKERLFSGGAVGPHWEFPPPSVAVPPPLERSLAWLSGVEGGYPPYLGKRFLTGKPSDFTRARGRLDAFKAQAVDDGSLPGFRGDDGDIQITAVSNLDALALLGVQLDRLDLRMPRKLQLLMDVGAQFADTAWETHTSALSEQEDGRRRNNLMKKLLQLKLGASPAESVITTAREQLPRLLLDDLIRGQLRVVASALDENLAAHSGSFLADGLTEPKSRPTNFTDAESVLLTSIANCKAIADWSPLQSYFYSTGGVFQQLSTLDIQGKDYGKASNSLLQSLVRLVNASVTEQIIQRAESLSYWKKYFDEGYANKIAALQRAVDQAREEFRQNSDLLKRIGGDLSSASASGKQAVASYAGDDYAGMSISIFNFGESISSAISKFQQTTVSAAPELEKKLQTLRDEYRAFTQETEQKVTAMVAERNVTLANALDAGRQYRSSRIVDVVQFEYVLRGIVQNFLSGSVNDATLANNLRGLRSTLVGPLEQLPINISRLSDNCSGATKVVDVRSAGEMFDVRGICMTASFNSPDAVILVSKDRKLLNGLPLRTSAGKFMIQSAALPLEVKLVSPKFGKGVP